MRETGILFKGEMVRAVLRGTKTMTRRIVKPQLMIRDDGDFETASLTKAMLRKVFKEMPESFGPTYFCPYGQPGDRLWVKETFCCVHGFGGSERTAQDALVFRADDGEDAREITKLRGWTPSLLMPRIYSRILLEITSTRVERLQAISGMDAKREGVTIPSHLPQDGADLDWARREFQDLWIRINGEPSWHSDPWVWVLEFHRVEASA